MDAMLSAALAEGRDDLRSALARLARGEGEGAARRAFERIGASHAAATDDASVRHLARILLAAQADAVVAACRPAPPAAPPPPEAGRAATVLATTAALAAVAALVGARLFAVLLVAVSAALGWLSMTGRLADVAGRWPLSLLLAERTQRVAESAAAEARAEAALAAVSAAMRGLEEAAAAFDDAVGGLLRRRAAERPAPRPAGAVPPELSALLQDLGEAAAAGDASFALRVAARRPRPVAGALGLALVEASADTLGLFDVEGLPEAEGGALETVRPAVVRGDECLNRGLARRVAGQGA